MMNSDVDHYVVVFADNIEEVRVDNDADISKVVSAARKKCTFEFPILRNVIAVHKDGSVDNVL